MDTIQRRLIISINSQKAEFDEQRRQHNARLMEKVVTLAWLRKGKPSNFDIPMFQKLGRLRCRATYGTIKVFSGVGHKIATFDGYKILNQV